MAKTRKILFAGETWVSSPSGAGDFLKAFGISPVGQPMPPCGETRSHGSSKTPD
jgi:hypothetical protein